MSAALLQTYVLRSGFSPGGAKTAFSTDAKVQSIFHKKDRMHNS